MDIAQLLQGHTATMKRQLILTTKSPGVTGTHFTDLERMNHFVALNLRPLQPLRHLQLTGFRNGFSAQYCSIRMLEK